jgi:hypothetical protein
MNIGRAAKAGNEIQATLVDLYYTLIGVHAETVIGAAAALAGDQALRATCNPLPRGRNSGGPQDDLLYAAEERGGITLWGTIREMALAAGAKDDALPDIAAVAARLNEPHDNPLFIPFSVPPQHLPQEWSPSAVPLLRAEVAGIAQKHGLSAPETALALAFAVGRLIDTTKEAFAPAMAAQLAAEIMIGVSRLDPAEVDKNGRSAKPYGPGGNTLSRSIGAPIDRHARIGVQLARLFLDIYSKIKLQVVETTIGALAAIAGERALIATGLPLPTHGFVFGGAPDKLLYGTNMVNAPRQKPNLWDIVTEAARRAGAAPNELPDYVDVIKRTAASAGSGNFPALSVPTEYYPLEWSPNACPKFRDALAKFAKQRGLNETDMALALAWAVAAIIDTARDKISPGIAARLALEIMVGTSRMAPLLVVVESRDKNSSAETTPAPTKEPDPVVPEGEAGGLSVPVDEMLRMVTYAFIGPSGQHMPTLVAAAAALAGEQARLATGKPTPEDGWVRNDDANKLLYRGEDEGAQTLWTIVRDAALKAKAQPGNLPRMRDVMDRTLAAPGRSMFPAFSVSESYWPKEWPMEICFRLRQKLEDIRIKNKLSHAEAAVALAQVVAAFIGSSAAGHSPASMATLAMETMAALTRFSPSKPAPARALH